MRWINKAVKGTVFIVYIIKIEYIKNNTKQIKQDQYETLVNKPWSNLRLRRSCLTCSTRVSNVRANPMIRLVHIRRKEDRLWLRHLEHIPHHLEYRYSTHDDVRKTFGRKMYKN